MRLQVKRCWDLALRSAGGLAQRRAAVAAFNASSRFRKRGLAAVPTKFGISFTTKFLNQARACSATQVMHLLHHQIPEPGARVHLLWSTSRERPSRAFWT